MAVSRYRTILPLAAGGMGRVDLALRGDQGFERVYAIKRLHETLRDDAGLRKMFLDEARLAGLIRHAHVVSVLDVGEDEDGPYLVMDYVEGLPLTQILVRHRAAGEALPLQLGLRIGSQMAAGLHAAHELRDLEGRPLELVHRDVSPSNVIVGFDGVVRLTDFGVAKALGRSTQTDAGVLKGKLSYMSPEQLRFTEPDRRSDLFALGVVLYQLVAGRHPYGDAPSERAKNVIAENTPDLGEETEAPPELVELLYELLASNRENRPATADEVRQRLDVMLADRLAVEGPLELSDYMRRVYGDHLEVSRARVQKARALSRRPPASGWNATRIKIVAALVLSGFTAGSWAVFAAVGRAPVSPHADAPTEPVSIVAPPTDAPDAGFDSGGEVADAGAEVPTGRGRARRDRGSSSRPGLMEW